MSQECMASSQEMLQYAEAGWKKKGIEHVLGPARAEKCWTLILPFGKVLSLAGRDAIAKDASCCHSGLPPGGRADVGWQTGCVQLGLPADCLRSHALCSPKPRGTKLVLRSASPVSLLQQ